MERRTWFITGISSGIGKALAEKVIMEGDFVIGTLRKDKELAQFKSKNKRKAVAFKLDITDHQSIDSVVRQVEEEYGNIDILVNNAGFGFAGAIEETSIGEVRQVFEANFFGTLKLTQAVLPSMRKRRKGHIVQISSHGGIKAFAGFGIYNASKFALEGFSEALAQEVEPLGIRVSIVEPGPFRTKFAASALRMAEKVIEDYGETAGVFRSKLKGVDGLQEGDPAKAAEAIFTLVGSGEKRLRLPLGKVAMKTIGMKIKEVKEDLEKGQKVAENAVFID